MALAPRSLLDRSLIVLIASVSLSGVSFVRPRLAFAAEILARVRRHIVSESSHWKHALQRSNRYQWLLSPAYHDACVPRRLRTMIHPRQQEHRTVQQPGAGVRRQQDHSLATNPVRSQLNRGGMQPTAEKDRHEFLAVAPCGVALEPHCPLGRSLEFRSCTTSACLRPLDLRRRTLASSMSCHRLHRASFAFRPRLVATALVHRHRAGSRLFLRSRSPNLHRRTQSHPFRNVLLRCAARSPCVLDGRKADESKLTTLGTHAMVHHNGCGKRAIFAFVVPTPSTSARCQSWDSVRAFFDR